MSMSFKKKWQPSLIGFVLLISAASSAIAVPPGAKNQHFNAVTTLTPFIDEDHDDDEVLNENDAFPRNPFEWLDNDGDGAGDNADSDDDNDGVPDSFELTYDFDPFVPDSTEDADGDGSSNLQEYQKGTNPRNLLSCSGSSCTIAPAPAPAQVTFPAVDPLSDAVGATAGTFNVSSTGNAEYTIPLYMPAGTAGFAPKLALQYHSNGGYGILGEGWSLAPMSTISRCPQTRIQDGQAKGVTYTADDRFCIDGQRLVLLDPADTYGANGVEYRTETDSFRKIVSYGSAGIGPAYFRVWNRDGTVSEYGNTYNSRVYKANAGSILVWAQNRLEDIRSYNGAIKNPILYHYSSEPSQLYVQKIEYGFANTETANVTIEFLTEMVPSSRRVFTHVRTDYITRLRSIVVSDAAGGYLREVRRYDITYLADTRRNWLNKIASIKECVASTCLPATQFTWSDASTDYALTAGNSIAGFSTYPFTNDEFVRSKPTDFNGDGYSDLIWLEPGFGGYSFKASPSDGQTLIQATTQSAAGHAIDAWTVADYDQDGYPDILFTSDGALYLYLNTEVNNERSYNTEAIQLIANLDMATEPELDGDWFSPKGIFADVNADGLIDLLYNKAFFIMERDASQTHPYGPYKFGSPVIVTLGSPDVSGTLNSDIKAALGTKGTDFLTVDLDSAKIEGDMNADGLPDLVVSAWYSGTSPAVKAKVVLQSDGEGGLKFYDWFSDVTDATQNDRPVYVADLNSDGFSDVVWFQKTQAFTNYWHIRYGGISKFHAIQELIPEAEYAKDVSLRDINQDGLPDFVYRLMSTNKLRVIFNDGRGSFPLNSTPFELASTTDTNLDNHLFMDISGDGIADWVDLSDKVWLGNKASNTAYNKVVHIENGLGEAVGITYSQFTDPSVYTREFDASSLDGGFPVLDVFMPITVVSAVSRSAPIPGNPNNMHTTNYRYQGLKIQPGGRGSLGFRIMDSIEAESGNVVRNVFHQEYPFIGLLAETHTYVNGEPTPLTETVNTYSKLPHLNGVNVPPYLVVLAQSTTTQRVAESSASVNSPEVTISGMLSATTTTYADFDSYGNFGETSTVITGDGSTHTTTTSNTYVNDASTWLIGKLTQTQVARHLGGLSSSRTTSYAYDTYGSLLTEVREPQGSASLKLTTSYERDGFGNAIKITESSAAGSRYSRMVYDSTGRFVNKTYNGLEQLVSDVTQRDAMGNPETIKGLNGVEQYYRYGAFGRQFFAASNAGNTTTVQYRKCTGAVACPAGGVYRMQMIGNDGALSIAYADKLAREIRTEKKGFDGTLAIVDTQYDTFGRVEKKSEPYFSGETSYWTTFDYDHLGRVIKVTDPREGITTTHFSRYTNGAVVGNQQLTTNQLNQTKTTITDGRGQNIRVVDSLNGYIEYSYDADGNLVHLNANGVISSIDYDVLGRRISLDDPDQGAWDYIYNAFGEMTDQQDSAGNLTHTDFDALGRMTHRRDYNGSMLIKGDASWTYGTSSAAHNIGLVVQEQDLVSNYLKLYTYDTLGRLQQAVTSLGVNGADGDYVEYQTYDQYGRKYQTIDATAKGVQHVYNSHGHLEKLVEATNPGRIYHQVAQMNARGQVTGETMMGGAFQMARGYSPQTGLASSILATSSQYTPTPSGATLLDINISFDGVGNLDTRTRQVKATSSLSAHTLSETFTYDPLNRLTQIAATGQATQSLSYDLLGNIISKSDVGSYSYGANGAGPHAVTSVGGVAYNYDAIGNMLTGDGRSATYNVFRKPVSLTKGSHTTSFEYGPDRSHYKRIDIDSAELTTTVTVGSVEFIKTSAGQVATKRYIGGVVMITDSTVTGREEHVLLMDHLGSIVAIAEHTALNLQQLDYDAFGKRRNLWDLNALASSDAGVLSKLTTKGFTGHEMVDGVGIIHMKGRIYDPMLGRFMSADPYVTELDNTQNMNRYSYAYNNPLTLTDPSGFCVENCLAPRVDIRSICPGTCGFDDPHYDWYDVYFNWDGTPKACVQTDSCIIDPNGVPSDAITSPSSPAPLTIRGLPSKTGTTSGPLYGPPSPIYGPPSPNQPTTPSNVMGANDGAVAGVLNTDADRVRQLAQSKGRGLTDPYVRDYDRNNPNFHEYEVGAHSVCIVSNACNAATVFSIVDAEAVPFKLVPPGNGETTLLGTNPINHYAIGSFSVNDTLDGHWFHPGTVVHAVFESDGLVWVYTRGVGTGEDQMANMAIGIGAFGKMHADVQTRVDYELIGRIQRY